MDFKVTNKETIQQFVNGRYYKADQITSDTFELFPVFGDIKGNVNPNGEYIIDTVIINDPVAEKLDRAVFALTKQRGQDPLDKDDGVQWSQYALGEIPDAVLLKQVTEAVQQEGHGVVCEVSGQEDGKVDFTIKIV